jgi:hypothetical protein
MASDLSVVIDHLSTGLLEVRRQLFLPGSLLLGERVEAIEHIKVAYAAIINLGRTLRRAQRRDGDGSSQSRLLMISESGPNGSHGENADDWRAVHEEIKNTDQLWRSLAFDGLQSDGRGGLIEYRRCPHRSSTLGRRVSRQEAIEICQLSAEVHARSLEALASGPDSLRRRKVVG